MKKPPSASSYSQKSFGLSDLDPSQGESVKVVLRVRPMSSLEAGRNDENCVKIANEQTIQLADK